MTLEKDILVGFIFGAANLWLLSRVVAGMVHADRVPQWKTATFFVTKMILIFVTIGLILWKGYVTPLAFLGGFTISLVSGILFKMWSGGASKGL